MSETKKILYENDKSERLDKFLTSYFCEFTRSYIKTLIEKGNVLVNGKVVKSGYALKASDEICLIIPDIEEISAEPEDIDLNIVYEDSDLLVINKQAGLVVHPCATTKKGTLVNALMYHIKDLSGINGVLRPGIVHRLDKDTAGLMIVAKNDKAHKFLSMQLKDKTLNREYLALVNGRVKENFFVEGYIGRNPKNRQQMALVSDDKGKYSYTEFFIEKSYTNYTLLRCELKTGRTHQIRVHLKSKNRTIVGDHVYGGENKLTKHVGQLLFAFKIGFVHPTTKTRMEFKSPPPDYFLEALTKLEKIENSKT